MVYLNRIITIRIKCRSVFFTPKRKKDYFEGVSSMKRKLLSVVLVMAMIISVLPAGLVLADEPMGEMSYDLNEPMVKLAGDAGTANSILVTARNLAQGEITYTAQAAPPPTGTPIPNTVLYRDSSAMYTGGSIDGQSSFYTASVVVDVPQTGYYYIYESSRTLSNSSSASRATRVSVTQGAQRNLPRVKSM